MLYRVVVNHLNGWVSKDENGFEVKGRDDYESIVKADSATEATKKALEPFADHMEESDAKVTSCDETDVAAWRRNIINRCARNTHTIWSQSFADDVSEAFGFKCKTRAYRDSSNRFKGVTLTGNPGDVVENMVETESVLMQIASHLGHTFSDDVHRFNGRGFRVSAMVRSLTSAFPALAA